MEFRKGAVGAMMDEYERAAAELKTLIGSISRAAYEKVVDPQTQDENCRSIATIVSHVVSAGYSYADYLRDSWRVPSARPAKRMLSFAEATTEMQKMIDYTNQTLDGRWEMPEDQMMAMQLQSRWGPTYDLEQMLEHAIVHILRHRRQTQKFLLYMDSSWQ